MDGWWNERPTADPALRSAVRRPAFDPAPPSIMEHPPTVAAFPLADVPCEAGSEKAAKH